MNSVLRQTLRKGRGGRTTRSQQRDKAIVSIRKRRAHTRKPSQARKIGRWVEAGEATKKSVNNVHRQATELSKNIVRHRRSQRRLQTQSRRICKTGSKWSIHRDCRTRRRRSKEGPGAEKRRKKQAEAKEGEEHQKEERSLKKKKRNTWRARRSLQKQGGRGRSR